MWDGGLILVLEQAVQEASSTGRVVVVVLDSRGAVGTVFQDQFLECQAA